MVDAHEGPGRVAESLPVHLFPGTAGLSRRERTHHLLMQAGVSLLAEERTEVSVLEITRTAGVGQGTFYNHFDSKSVFFQQSLEYAVQIVADLADEVVPPERGPVEHCNLGFRVIGRIHRQVPTLSLAWIRRGSDFYTYGDRLVNRVRDDLRRGIDAGEFRIRDAEGAVATVLGAMVMLGQRIHNNPEQSDAEMIDAVSGDLLQMLGVPEARIAELLAMPVPELTLRPPDLTESSV